MGGDRKMEKMVRTSPLELAAILEEAARSLRERGVFSAAGLEVAPGEELELEVEFEEKKGRGELELEIRWRMEKEPAEVPRPLPSAPGFRGLKREMDSLLRVLRERPEAQAAERWEELVEAFAAQARPEWQSGMEELKRAGEKLKEALSRGDRAAASAAVEELLRVKKECHRRFR